MVNSSPHLNVSGQCFRRSAPPIGLIRAPIGSVRKLPTVGLGQEFKQQSKEASLNHWPDESMNVSRISPRVILESRETSLFYQTKRRVVRTATSRLHFAFTGCQSALNCGGRELDGRGEQFTIHRTFWRHNFKVRELEMALAAAYQPAHS